MSPQRPRCSRIHVGVHALEEHTSKAQPTSILFGKRTLAIVVLIVMISSIIVVGQSPVHRTNIEHSDLRNDVLDPNCDIIQIRSYLSGNDITLEMTVAGRINISSTYLYRLTIVAKHSDEDSAHIYALTCKDGTVSQFDLSVSIENDTITIFFPLTQFISNSYMIGLEGWASNMSETDMTMEDRNGTVARLLFW